MDRRASTAVAVLAALFAALVYAGRPGLAWTVGVPAFLLFCFATRLSLSAQVGIGVILGVGLGVASRSLADAAPGEPALEVERIRFVGRIFIAMLRMLIVPMILLSISSSIAGLRSATDLGRIGLRTLALYLTTMVLAVLVGASVAVLLRTC